MKNIFISIWIALYIFTGLLCVEYHTEIINIIVIKSIISIISFSRAIYLLRLFNNSSTDTYN